MIDWPHAEQNKAAAVRLVPHFEHVAGMGPLLSFGNQRSLGPSPWPGRRRDSREFLGDFFSIVDSAGRTKRLLVDRCPRVGGM